MALMKSGGRSSGRLGDFSASEALGPGTKLIKLTKGADFATAHGCPKALWVGTAGTVNITDFEGNECVAFPLFEGRNEISISEIAIGGDADDIWGMF